MVNIRYQILSSIHSSIQTILEAYHYKMVSIFDSKQILTVTIIELDFQIRGFYLKFFELNLYQFPN